jgi:outer membrane protein OmpA-like peptidoglycan-associated protein
MGIGGTREGRLTFRNILFDFNSAELKRESLAQLEEMGKALLLLARERRMRFRIEGHTDAKGSDAYNQSLSQRRAAAVVRHLIGRHAVPRSNLRGIGLGESRPVASNKTIAGQALNRRVVVVLDE